jgi:hypothetical protein
MLITTSFKIIKRNQNVITKSNNPIGTPKNFWAHRQPYFTKHWQNNSFLTFGWLAKTYYIFAFNFNQNSLIRNLENQIYQLH